MSYWKLDEASGSRADSYGSNTLTPVNTPGSAAGKLGDASTHVYASLQYLEASSNASLQLGDQDLTLTMWVYLSDISHFHFFVAKDGSSSGQREFIVYLEKDLQRLCFGLYKATDSPVEVVANNFGVPPTATWMFICARYNSSTDTMSFSVNNGTPDTGSTAGPLQAASNGSFQIGGSARFPSQYQHSGRIDSVGYWKRVLTDEEVTNLYNAGTGLEYPF